MSLFYIEVKNEVPFQRREKVWAMFFLKCLNTIQEVSGPI